MVQKQILLNAFSMNCVGHINHGLWTHPDDRSTRYVDLDYWTDLAKLLERGKFDGLFLADVLGAYDIYGGSLDIILKEAVQLPINDPLLVVPAMAAVTKHLGFGVTSNVMYEPPFLFARRMSTLDHLTKGRVAWNIVTGYLDSAARAMGLARQVAHDERYDLAEEYLELVYKLWEGSWADDAVVRDREGRVFARPDRIRKIAHAGKHFQLDSVHLSEPSPQRTPVLFQAGSSSRGQDFAATHAECVFISNQSPAGARDIVATLRDRVAHAGRRREDVKVFMGITVVVAPTDAEARDKYEEYRRYASPQAGLAHFASATGIDFSRFAPDEPITHVRNEAINSAVDAITRRETGWTVSRLLDQLALGGRYATVVGSPSTVADALQGWIRDTDLDGFNLTRTVTPQSFADFIDLVVPELQDRGAYKTEYAEGTLREKLFPGTGARLPDTHAAARQRYPHEATAGSPRAE